MIVPGTRRSLVYFHGSLECSVGNSAEAVERVRLARTAGLSNYMVVILLTVSDIANRNGSTRLQNDAME
jgi:hypothetical protein